MPQLMPFYWMNSVFMVLIIIVTLVFFYWYKNVESLNNFNTKKNNMIMFNFMW